MSGLRRDLPPIASLLAFEATARLMSLSKAAAALNVTQPAISRQLKLLERDIGTELYIRRSRGIELTPKGRELFDAISLGFNHVSLALENIRGSSRTGVALGATIGFATFWLMPQLNRFTAQHPHGSAGPLRDKKGALYEGGIRVPGIVRWPGHAPTGSVSDEPVCGVDFLPTVCEITGLEPPRDRTISG